MTGETPPSAAAYPALPWRSKLTIFFLSLVTDAARRSDGTINRRLLSLFEISARPNPEPVRGVRTADVTVDSARDLWFRLFLPAASSSLQGDGAGLPVLVFFHGGGFAFLSPASQVYDAVCRRFCRKLPAAVISVNYRLSPEHRYPAPYDDGIDVLRFLAGGHGGGLPLLREFFQVADLTSCFLAGDSAGANIAHHVARRWTTGEAPPRSCPVALAGLVAIQPFFGGEGRVESEIRLPRGPVVSTERTDWLWRAFLPEGAGRDHEAASPEGAVAGLSEDFPPAMVVIGGFDPLQDWQRRYCEGLRRAGKEATLVEYPAAVHGFYAFPELKDATALMEELKGFIREQQTKRRQRQGGLAGADDGEVADAAP